MKKITIISDSLGMPRKDMNISNTWTYRIMKEYQGKAVVYFYPQRGLHTRGVAVSGIEDLIDYQESDIVIFQVGIVDCCRRVLSRKIYRLISFIPIVGNTFIKGLNRYSYLLTSLYDCKWVNEDDFRKNIKKLVERIRNKQKDAYIFWIEIGKPCNNLVKKVFNVCDDAQKYNDILQKLSEELNFKIVKPYSMNGDINNNEIFIADGHHLSLIGHNFVYEAINRELEGVLVYEQN